MNTNTKIDPVQAQFDVNALCDRDAFNKKLNGLNYRDLRQHTAQIVLWAKADRSSKRKVARLVSQKLGLKASPDKIYRFVKSVNNGNWPHHRTFKREEK